MIDNESKSNVLKRNLLALSSIDPDLAARLSAAAGTRNVRYIESRSGLMIPALLENGRLTALHSRFDPRKEAERYRQSVSGAGCIVFLGLGAGYQILPFLREPHIFQLVVVDKEIGISRSIMEHIDMRAVLMDSRVKILLDPAPSEIKSALLGGYLPLLAGNLATVSLQARVAGEKPYFQSVAETVQEAIDQVADDYTVQSRFGKKWFVNSLANLPKAARTTQTLRPERKIMITGAGPSLEDHVERIRSLRGETFLIASDTSLPTLLAHGIKPDLVISIDCQQVSYHHFLGGYPRDVPMVLDLASPPVLTSLTDRLVFFSSGHPLSQYVNSHWRRFPLIDTSGGNVSHAALSLAALLGAEDILLFGIDFSYPEGKSYARGTYIYRYFRAREQRFTPLETQNFSFLLSNRSMLKQRTGRSIRYTTQPMISYKTRMEKAIHRMSARVVQAEGRGLVLNIGAHVTSKVDRLPSMLSQGTSKTNWKEFLGAYGEAVALLEAPRGPIGNYWNELTPEDKKLWITMLPAATAIKEQWTDTDATPGEVLRRTKRWTLMEVERRLKAAGGEPKDA